MSLWRTLKDKNGRIYVWNHKGFWDIDLDTKDPSIPNLPLITPAVGGYSGILKRWTGSGWVKETLQTYLAGSWQTKPLKRWTGSAWVTVDTTGV